MPAPQQPTQLIRVPAVLDKTREEIKGLVSLCEMDIPQEEKAKRLDSLHEDWFSIDAVRNIFKRIRASRSLSGQVPGFHSIANDTTLPPESQNIARAVVSAGAAYQFNTADWDSFTRMLRNNFTMTQYVRMHHEIGDQLRAMDPNLIGTIESTLLQYQASISKHVAQRKLPVRLGAGATDNSALLSRILNPNRSESFIKTGFPEFDRRTGGFKYGQVLLTMSRFGGGKSALALSMGINMAKGGKRGAYISFELGEDELFERFITNVSGVDGNNIRIGGDQLSDSDRARIEARYAEFNTGEGSLSLICPNTLSAGGWDINDTLKVIEGCGYDFVIFDYLGLIQYHKLEGISSAREDQILSDMARKIKIHCESHRYFAVVLHQMTEEGKIANARAIGAHVDFIWKWEIKEEDRERGYVTIEQDKARGAPVYDMIFSFAFQFMRMANLREAPTADFGASSGPRSHQAGQQRVTPMSLDITAFR